MQRQVEVCTHLDAVVPVTCLDGAGWHRTYTLDTYAQKAELLPTNCEASHDLMMIFRDKERSSSNLVGLLLFF